MTYKSILIALGIWLSSMAYSSASAQYSFNSDWGSPYYGASPYYGDYYGRYGRSHHIGPHRGLHWSPDSGLHWGHHTGWHRTGSRRAHGYGWYGWY